MSPEHVLTFWFDEHSSDDWYGGQSAFDDKVRDNFGEWVPRAEACELFHWRQSPQGRLAEIIILDQFTRQLFRGEARAFASDNLALALAQEAVASGSDLELTPSQRQFLYMPYMHSESLVIQNESVRIFAGLSEDILKFAERHRDVIQRFGRFPKRNEALGRTATREEQAYIADRGDSMF